MVEISFCFFLFLIVYTYFLYPLILLVLRIFIMKPVHKKDIVPSVSMIIAAHNEEKSIREKIENSLKLDYPKDKLEIIVASDASTDNTDKIVKEYEDRGIVLIRQEERRGKTAAQNKAVNHARGEILVFSDAPTIYRSDALKKLVRNYNDKEVGCVTGEVIYMNSTDSAVGEGGSLYWRYESKIKQLESDIGSILGAAGCIYSMRRSLYTPFDEEYISDFVSPLKIIIENRNIGDHSLIEVDGYQQPSLLTVESGSIDDDFVTPLRFSVRGIRSIMEPEAISIEHTSKSLSEEFKMRSRVITRAISGLLHMRRILNPFKFPKYSFQLFSHKILRWLVPVFMIIVFLLNMFILNNKLFYLAFQLQLLFYILTLIGFAMDKAGLLRIKFFFIPYYFCVVNLAALMGVLKYVVGKRDTLWTPSR